MESEFLKQIGIECVKIVIPSFLKRVSPDKRLKAEEIAEVSGIIQRELPKAIERHLTEVVNWASRLQFFGMGAPQSTEQSTIALGVYTQARRFQLVTDPGKTATEEDLLSNQNHILLLGEPGSGKTTTLKRIALNMLTKEPTNLNDIYQFPIVIRLRELHEEESLSTRIADNLGLCEVSREFHVLGSSLNSMIVDCLDKAQILLLLDGLDEVGLPDRNKLRNEIVNLGRQISRSKIIVSCRSGDYTKQMDGFAVFEISPLSDAQIHSIAKIWLGRKYTAFINRLRYFPYVDVTDRPLLLTQLLFMFKRSGYFPEQPTEVYAKLVNLLLRDWDEQKDIKRISEYAGFGAERKAKFLAALAYHLTYSLEKTRFKEDDLVTTYRAICGRFGLPTEEAVQVAREIQTHTGIIAIGPEDVYEFCHLSLQEYLCADYLVRASTEIPSIRHLSRYCAPLAVAVALSSDPSQWFGSLILSSGNIKHFNEASMASFLSRVLLEHPILTVSEPLGLAMLALFQLYKNSSIVCGYLERMLEISSVKTSIADAMRWYLPKREQPFFPDFFAVTLKRSILQTYPFDLPSEGVVPRRILPDLDNIKNGHLFTKEKR